MAQPAWGTGTRVDSALTGMTRVFQAATPVSTENSYYKACAGAAEASATTASVVTKAK
jgi:hypothetical protein